MSNLLAMFRGRKKVFFCKTGKDGYYSQARLTCTEDLFSEIGVDKNHPYVEIFINKNKKIMVVRGADYGEKEK